MTDAEPKDSAPASIPLLDRRDAQILTACLLFVVMLFGHVLFTRSDACVGSPEGDGRTQYYPWRLYGFERLRHGQIPLWNPYTFAGMPFVANLQSAIFYPTNWLCLVLPPSRAMNVSVVLNLFLSLAFTYGWARMTGRGRLGALVAGATYAMGAWQFLRVYEGHWAHLCAMPWIPWMAACAEVLVRRGGWVPVALGAAGLAVQAFAGHPQYMFFGSIAVSLYFVARLAMEPRLWRDGRALARRLLGFTVIFLAGMVMAAAQMLPSLELLSVSSRRGRLPFEWIAQYSLAPESLLTMLVPWLYGIGPEVPYWGPWNAWEMGVYPGIVSLGLAVFGLFAGKRRWSLLAGGMVLALLLPALGGNTPLLRLLVRLPGFGLFRGMSRFTAPMGLFVGLLAGVGADALFRDGRRSWRAGLVAVGVLAGLMWAMAVVTARPTNQLPEFWKRFVLASLDRGCRPVNYHDPDFERSFAFVLLAYRTAWASLARSTALISLVAMAAGLWRRRFLSVRHASVGLVLLLACDVWTFCRPYLVTFDGGRFAWTAGARQFLSEQTGPFRVTTGDLYNDGPLDALVFRVPCLDGVEPNVPVRFRDLFWRALGESTDAQKTAYHVSGATKGLNLLRLLNWRFMIARKDDPVADIRGTRTVYRDDAVRIDELPRWLPRARLVPRARVVPDAKQALEALARSHHEMVTILEHPPPPWPSRPGPKGLSPQPKIVSYEPERVVVECVATCASYLVLADLFYPGWTARLDSRPVPILRADYMLRSVQVPPGKHRVEFVYDPWSFKLGAWLSGIGWSAVAAFLVARTVRNRRARPHARA